MEDVGVGVVGFRDVGEVFGEFFFFGGGIDLARIEFASFLVGHEMPQGYQAIWLQAKSKEDGFDMVLTGVSLGGGMAAMIGSKEGAAPHRVPRKLWTKVKRWLLTHCNGCHRQYHNTSQHHSSHCRCVLLLLIIHHTTEGLQSQ
jgi:hypothetical protein